MSESQIYRVRVPHSVAQGGRFLEVGETLEMEPHVAAAEFAGRLETLDGVVVTAAAPAAAFADELARARPHEQAALIARRRAALEAELASLPTDGEADP
jgi:hypothetical protein